MPAYANIHTFMAMVRIANPTYERWVRSSLRPLIAVLNDNNGTAQQVCAAIAALPADKVARYIDPLYFLLADYPNMPANAGGNLNVGALHQTQAHHFTQAALPGNFNPAAALQANRVFVTSNNIVPLGQTMEQYILANDATVSVLLIHLSGIVGGMERVYNGRTTIQHIVSVLRVARLRGCPVCALTMDAARDVCNPMAQDYNLVANRTRIYEPQHHTSSRADFIAFVTARANLVVMGFDGAVCVAANLFGTNQNDTNGQLVRPLLTRANIVLSRATIVSNDLLSSIASPSMGRDEYGPLFLT